MYTNKLITRECKYCKQKFDSIWLFDFISHVRTCKEKPNSNKEREKLLREEARKRVLIRRHGLLKKFQVTCKYCKKLFEVEENEKDFPKKKVYHCSRSCANAGRVVGVKTIKCSKCLNEVIVSKKAYKKTCENCKPKKRVCSKQKCEDILNGKTQRSFKKDLIFKFGYKVKKCEICNIIDWQGKSLTFHVHHIDGNYLNNMLSNLQVLCPNCHSQTENWGFKKRHKKTKNCGVE